MGQRDLRKAVRPSPSSNRNKNCDTKYTVRIPTVVSWSVCRERVCWIVGSSQQPRTTTQRHESQSRGLAVVASMYDRPEITAVQHYGQTDDGRERVLIIRPSPQYRLKLI